MPPTTSPADGGPVYIAGRVRIGSCGDHETYEEED